MAIVKYRLRKRTDVGLDTYHLETESNIVLRNDILTPASTGSVEETLRALETSTMSKLFSGVRSKKYKICTYVRGSGSSTSGECILYCDRAGGYGTPNTSTWYIGYTGDVTETIFGKIDSLAKNIMIYKSDVTITSTTVFTVYLEAPNYNDGWTLYIKKAINCNFDVVDVTATWETEIAGKYLSSRTEASRQTGYGLCVNGVLYKNLAQLASPNFTGTPTAVTAPNGTNTKQLATCEFVINNTSEILSSTAQPTSQKTNDFWLEPIV